MRTEMAIFDKKYPPNTGLICNLKAGLQKLAIWNFKRRIAKIKLGSRKWHALQEKLNHFPSVGIGSDKRNIFYMETLNKCGKDLYILPNVTFYFPQNITIGTNVFINRGVYITARGRIEIGNHVAIGPYTVINSGSHKYSEPNKLIRQQGHRIEPIIIEDGAWLGAHITVLPGITIGEGAVVGAGAVVTKSVQPFSVVAGVPARPLTCRTE